MEVPEVVMEVPEWVKDSKYSLATPKAILEEHLKYGNQAAKEAAALADTLQDRMDAESALLNATISANKMVMAAVDAEAKYMPPTLVDPFYKPVAAPYKCYLHGGHTMPMYSAAGCAAVGKDAKFAGAQAKYDNVYGECLKKQGGSYTWDKRGVCAEKPPSMELEQTETELLQIEESAVDDCGIARDEAFSTCRAIQNRAYEECAAGFNAVPMVKIDASVDTSVDTSAYVSGTSPAGVTSHAGSTIFEESSGVHDSPAQLAKDVEESAAKAAMATSASQSISNL